VASSFPLASCFLPHLPDATRRQFQDNEEVERALGRWLTEARAAWPDVELLPEIFLPFAAERVARTGVTDLAALHASDVYIVCACAAGDERAIVALEARYFPVVDAAIRRMRIAVSIDELRQELRIRLLVATDGSRPRIDQYNGKGDLQSWLRVSATRAALRLARRRRPEAHGDADRLSRLAAGDIEPELRHAHARVQPIFRDAFAQALAALSDRQRTLLSHHYVDELSSESIGAIYGVHRATAQRWVAQARDELQSALRERVALKLGSDVVDVDSVLRYVKSHLEITLSRLLADAAKAEE
jgi:RNA polymerase sigma-70 factor (ECF subfamily)